MSATPRFSPGWSGGAGGPVILGRLLSLLLLAALGALLLMVAIPVAIALLVVGVIAAAWFWARRRIAGWTRPNGVFDGRRNVRVVPPRTNDSASDCASEGAAPAWGHGPEGRP